ncbi:hypothetical protein Tco_0200747 [Tanacetum coccineum]
MSLDYASSPEFDLFSNPEDQFKEENTDTIGEPTMEENMTKTREDYGSRIARPKFDEKARFELKGQFLMKLCNNTFIGSDNEDENEYIERFLEIDDLFTIPDEVILFYKGMDVSTRQILDSKGVVPKMNATDAKKAIQEKADHS